MQSHQLSCLLYLCMDGIVMHSLVPRLLCVGGGTRLMQYVAQFTVCVYLQELFRFGGVYCGAVATIPFTVANKVRGL